jgi:pimeloyl-ACP methyl ester carboxylesterase
MPVIVGGEMTHKGIPGSKMVVFDNCGHFVPTEKANEFNRALLEFLPQEILLSM